MKILKTIRSLIKSKIQTIALAASNPAISFPIDGLIFKTTNHNSPTRSQSVLIAPPGGGNIGDQAMIESFIENTEGQISIIVRNYNDINLRKEDAHRVVVLKFRSLIYGGVHRHAVDFYKYCKLIKHAKSVSIIGADIMDGAYNWMASVNRANLAFFSAKSNVPTRVLGFSWNSKPDHRALNALRRASKSGVNLYLRDPLSAKRCRDNGLSNVIESADLVFSSKTIDLHKINSLSPQLTKNKPVAIINASGLIGKDLNQLKEYTTIILGLQERGFDIILLPHVSRPGGDDLVTSQEIFNELNDRKIIFIKELLKPAEIRGLCSRATIVITGRMHLSIMTLWNGVPAITLATQGKVEGLMNMFNTNNFCINPEKGFGEKILKTVDETLKEYDKIKNLINLNLKVVKNKSILNFKTPILSNNINKQ